MIILLIEYAIGVAIGASAKWIHDGNKALKLDSEALTKYGKAFTRECEAQQLVKQKRDLADKRLENVAKKKKAIIESSLPLFIEIYGQIQKINIQTKDKKYEMLEYTDFEKSSMLNSLDIVSKKEFTSKELIVGTMFKGITGMIVEDSKRNLSAARSQLNAANVVYSQAKSIAEVYDAIIGRSDRISKLLMNMNALFLGVIQESKKLIDSKGIDIKQYNEKEKSTLVLCVNFAVAMTNLLDIPVVDTGGEISQAAVEMIETGENYLAQMNTLINDNGV